MAAQSTEQATLALFTQQNKPFSLQNIVDLLAHAGHKKAAITKAIDALVEAGKLTAKEFGKTKIFLPNQAGLQVLTKEEMTAKKAAIKQHQDELKSERELLKTAEQELASWKSSLSIEQIQKESKELTEKLAVVDKRLNTLKSGAVLVTPEERAKVEKELVYCLEHWRKRRSIFKNIWDTMSESIEGRKEADLFEEMGVDTDASVGVDLKAIEALVAAKRRKL